MARTVLTTLLLPEMLRNLVTDYNIRPIVACAHRGVFIEPLPDKALIKSITLFLRFSTHVKLSFQST
jgi:hypothetical protein